MNTTSLLVKEHYLIEQVLNCLERMAERCECHLDAMQAVIKPASVGDAAVLNEFT